MSGGFEPSRFLNTYIAKEFLCSICTYTLKSPVQCNKCKIICCQTCSKKGPITCEHSFSTNSSLKAKIDDMSIKCKNWCQGCMEILKIRNVQAHEDSQCYYANTLCGRKECEEISLPGRIKHMPECGLFLISCETCKKELKQSDKEAHKCIEWLNTIAQNIETKTSVLKAENLDLAKKNKNLKEIYSKEGPELDRQISELKERNMNLTKEIDVFKDNTQKEIKALEEKSVDKMKVFHENAETRLKSLWNRSQFDYEHLSRRLNDHLKTYLDNVNNILTDFNNKAENEDLAVEDEKNQEKENGEKVKLNGNGLSAEKTQKQAEKSLKNQGSATKTNAKSPVALKK